MSAVSSTLLLDIILVLVLLILSQLFRVVWHIKHIRFAPESAVLILSGIALGGALWVIGADLKETVFRFEVEAFFVILLPPIIFAAGYNIHRNLFFKNIGTILSYAVVGTFLSTIFTGLLLVAVSKLGWISLQIDYFEALTFGSLINAVDPVAVLAVFEEAHTDHNLAIILEGESILNDAVAIVLYSLFESFAVDPDTSLNLKTGSLSILEFFIVSIGGLIIGVVLALLCTLITKFTKALETVEPLMIMGCGMLAYIVAEYFHTSGIMAIMFYAIAASKYAEHNITHHSHIATQFSYRWIAGATETIVFIMLGLSLISEKDLTWNWGLNLSVVVIIMLVRAVVVTSLTALVNLRRSVKISPRNQFILIWGALRGAIAFSLAFSLPHNFNNKEEFVSCTLFIVLFTVFFNGATIKPILNWLKIKEDTKQGISSRVLGKVIPFATNFASSIVGEKKGFFGNLYERFEKGFVSRYLCVNDVTNEDKILEEALDSYLEDKVCEMYKNTIGECKASDDQFKLRVERCIDDLKQRRSVSPSQFATETESTPESHREFIIDEENHSIQLIIPEDDDIVTSLDLDCAEIHITDPLTGNDMVFCEDEEKHDRLLRVESTPAIHEHMMDFEKAAHRKITITDPHVQGYEGLAQIQLRKGNKSRSIPLRHIVSKDGIKSCRVSRNMQLGQLHGDFHHTQMVKSHNHLAKRFNRPPKAPCRDKELDRVLSNLDEIEIEIEIEAPTPPPENHKE
ncbi:hypothetical protein PCE1_002542 [Barthelona sp. PCE]